MNYKILEQNGVEITNIDGAVFQNFAAGGRSGIIKGALNECSVFASSSNTVAVNTGRLIISGVQVKITEPISWIFSSAPTKNTRYQIIADLTVSAGGEPKGVEVEFLIREIANLIQEEIFILEAGRFQLEIGRFTHTTSNTVEDCVRTADRITGGTGKGNGENYIKIGTVQAEMLDYGVPPEVDIENIEVEGEPQTNFYFGIPKTNITVSGVRPNENGDVPLIVFQLPENPQEGQIWFDTLEEELPAQLMGYTVTEEPETQLIVENTFANEVYDECVFANNEIIENSYKE